MPPTTFCPPAALPRHRRRRPPVRQCHHPTASTIPTPPPKPPSPNATTPHPAPVLRPSAAPAWDSGALCAPSVHRYESPSGPSYAMWYSARPSNWPGASQTPPGTLSGFAGLALSTDGLSWTRVPGPHAGAVLRPNTDDWWWFDTRHLSLGAVVQTASPLVRADAGAYFLYYSGGDAEPVSLPGAPRPVPGLRNRIGLALSKDGEHFTRLEGAFPSGAVLDVGPPGAFDEVFVAGPAVLRPTAPPTPAHAFVMHYHTFDPTVQRFAIGRALSRDGIAFARDADGPVLTGAGEKFAARGVSWCCVVERVGGQRMTYAMFVECVDDASVHRIALCESQDLETWGPLKVVLEPAADAAAWDAAGVSHPCAVVMEDASVRLYYVGKARDHSVDDGRGTCIGVAESRGTDWAALRRIPGAKG